MVDIVANKTKQQKMENFEINGTKIFRREKNDDAFTRPILAGDAISSAIALTKAIETVPIDNFSKQDETWAEFSILDVAAWVLRNCAHMKQNSLA